jgi:hypothetical protein
MNGYGVMKLSGTFRALKNAVLGYNEIAKIILS